MTVYLDTAFATSTTDVENHGIPTLGGFSSYEKYCSDNSGCAFPIGEHTDPQAICALAPPTHRDLFPVPDPWLPQVWGGYDPKRCFWTFDCHWDALFQFWSTEQGGRPSSEDIPRFREAQLAVGERPDWSRAITLPPELIKDADPTSDLIQLTDVGSFAFHWDPEVVLPNMPYETQQELSDANKTGSPVRINFRLTPKTEEEVDTAIVSWMGYPSWALTRLVIGDEAACIPSTCGNCKQYARRIPDDSTSQTVMNHCESEVCGTSPPGTGGIGTDELNGLGTSRHRIESLLPSAFR